MPEITCPKCGTKFEIIQPVKEFDLVSADGKISVDILSFKFDCPTKDCPKIYNWQNKERKSLQKNVKSSKV